MSVSLEECKTLGNSLFSGGEFLKAAAAYTRGIKLQSSSGSSSSDAEILSLCLSNRCLCFLRLSKLKQAFSDASSVISLRPSWHKGYFRLGSVLEAQGLLKDALEQYTISLEKAGEPLREVSLKIREINKRLGNNASGGAMAPAPETGGDSGNNTAGMSRQARRLIEKQQKKQKGGWVKQRDADLFLDKVKLLLPANLVTEVENAVKKSVTEECGPTAQELANTVASACLKKANATNGGGAASKCWELLAWFGLLCGNFKETGNPGTPEYTRRVELFEKFRETHAPGDAMPIPAEPRGLLMVATNLKESDAQRRTALEHLNSALLDARTRVAKKTPPTSLWDEPDVLDLLNAGALDKVTAIAVYGEGTRAEAAAGFLFNILGITGSDMASKAAGGVTEVDEAYTRLCALLDRPGNPLDAKVSDYAAAAAAANDDDDDESTRWDEPAAHAYFLPILQVLSAQDAKKSLFSHEVDIRLRVNCQHLLANSPQGEQMLDGFINIQHLLCSARDNGVSSTLHKVVTLDGVRSFQQAVQTKVTQQVALFKALGKFDFASKSTTKTATPPPPPAANGVKKPPPGGA